MIGKLIREKGSAAVALMMDGLGGGSVSSRVKGKGAGVRFAADVRVEFDSLRYLEIKMHAVVLRHFVFFGIRADKNNCAEQRAA